MNGALLSGLAFIFLLTILVSHHKSIPFKVKEWSDRFYEVSNGTANKGVFVTTSDVIEERLAVKEVEVDIVARQKVIDMKCRKYRSNWN